MYIPNTVYTAIDPRGLASPDHDATVTMNTSPIFGESCGADTPVFPFGGGAGTLRFHLTLQSVPLDARSDAIFMPPALMMGSITASEAIALFVLSWAEWPFGLYVVNRTMTNAVLANATEVVYVPTAATTRVPGSRDINIILPRRYSEQNPTSGQTANAQVVVQPSTGPTGTTLYPLGTLLNMCFVGNGGDRPHQLTDYLYSWAEHFDITTIKQYLYQLGEMMGVSSAVKSTHEMLIATTQVLSPLIVSEEQNGNRLLADAAPTFSLSNVAHGIIPITALDWPQPLTAPAIYRIFETNSTSWNKVALGLSTADNLAPEGSFCVPDHIGNPRNAFWERLLGLSQASVWKTMYSSFGLTTEAWESGYTNSNMPAIQNVVRRTFCTGSASGIILPPANGGVVAAIYKAMYHKELAQVYNESTAGSSRPLTAVDRYLPFSKYAASYLKADLTKLTGLTPTCLVDVWLNLMSQQQPKFMSTFPPPNQTDSTLGFGSVDNMVVVRNLQAGKIGPFEEKVNIRPAFDLNYIPDVDDKSRWNERLWYTEANRTIGDFAGTDVAGMEFPPAGQYPRQALQMYVGTEVVAPGTTGACTTSLAICTSSGLRVYPFLTQAEGSIPIKACQHLAQLNRDAWMLSGILSSPILQTKTAEISRMDSRFPKEQDFTKAKGISTAEPSMDFQDQLVDPNMTLLSPEPSTTTQI